MEVRESIDSLFDEKQKELSTIMTASPEPLKETMVQVPKLPIEQLEQQVLKYANSVCIPKVKLIAKPALHW